MHAQTEDSSAEQHPNQPEGWALLNGPKLIARMKLNRLSLATLLLILAGALAISLWLWWTACFHRNTQFLPHRHQAAWIVYPSPLAPRTRPKVELESKFRREFVLKDAPVSAILSLCSFKHGSVQVNQTLVPLPTTPQANWKTPLSADIGKFLRRGQNRIEVAVSNESGPPALWLSLRGDGVSLSSDAFWEVSYAGAVWRQARLAEEAIKIGPGSPIFGGERVVPSWTDRWPEFLLFALISFGIVIGGSWWFGRGKAFDQFVAPVSSTWNQSLLWMIRDPLAVCLVAIILLWILLFTHNAGLLPPIVGFDAQLHIDYVRYIQERGSLPLADEGMSMYNPPLYYLLAAGVLEACRLTTADFAGIILLRYLALAVGIVHLLLVFSSLRLIFPAQRGKQVIGLLLAGFLPAQIYLSHYITNEVLVSVLVTATLYACLRALRDERPSPARFAMVGAVMGLALLTKFTALLAAPFVMAAIVFQVFQKSPRDLKTWLRTAGLAALTCLLVCGWHYGRVWIHFGRPLVGAWETLSGHRWWQDPGYRTGAYFLRFGEALVNPLFSGITGFADGIYSTLWGDAYGGGAPALELRAPWNYELMAANYLPALVPTVMILVGAVISLGKFIRRPTPEGLLLNGLAWSFVAAFFHMALTVPCYSQIKAFYGLLILLPVCAFGAAGWEFFTRSRRLLLLTLNVALGLWALGTFGTYWISSQSAAMHVLLGQQLAVGGDHKKAVKEFMAALETEPHHLNAKSWLADSLAELGQREAANDLLKQLREEHPQSAVCQLDLGLILENQGRLPAAIEHTRRAVEAAPEDVVGHRLLVSRLMKAGQREQVIEACREGLRIAPADSELHSLLALGLMQPVRVSNSYSSPAEPSAPPGWSLVLAPSDPIEESIAHLRLASRLAPKAVGPLKNLAWILATYSEARWRNGPEAVQLAERACRLSDYHLPEVVGTLAAAYAEAGRFSEAITTAERTQILAKPLGQDKLLASIEQWIALFRTGQAYHDRPESLSNDP